ncbi:diaminopimelate epimerase [Buchnera aphidicola]|uniref:diaminopimelate epimerase n=1 Tax=Buchnera aphidicola TaxID=9 RepID=UPI003463CAF1
MNFSKMHGLGNDFVIINKINQFFNISSIQIQKLSDRNTGIGFDQLLIVEKSDDLNFDFFYRIFNSNGSEVSQCGNGARCFAYFVFLKKITHKKQLVLKTHTNIIYVKIYNKYQIKVNMGIPVFNPDKIPMLFPEALKKYSIIINSKKIFFGAVSIGNPHCVIIVNDILKYPIHELGSLISQHVLFPEQINVNFIQIINRNHIIFRVYERGVGETKACGSGACAAVVVGIIQDFLDSKVRVTLLGGDLNISWNGLDHAVYMVGPAEHVYDGNINLPII